MRVVPEFPAHRNLLPQRGLCPSPLPQPRWCARSCRQVLRRARIHGYDNIADELYCTGVCDVTLCLLYRAGSCSCSYHVHVMLMFHVHVHVVGACGYSILAVLFTGPAYRPLHCYRVKYCYRIDGWIVWHHVYPSIMHLSYIYHVIIHAIIHLSCYRCAHSAHSTF